MSQALPVSRQAKINEQKAWLLGLVAGDGHLQWDEGHAYKLFVNCGQDRQLADVAASAIQALYSVHCPVLVGRAARNHGRQPYFYPHCGRKAVLEDLLSLAPFGIYTWRVPERVLSGTKKIKAAWIRGFADAEGSIQFRPEKGQRQVSISSVNSIGLAQVSCMLTDLGIRHVTHVDQTKATRYPDWKPEHRLIVCYHEDLKRYAELVGFTCTRKLETLKAAVESYQRTPKRTAEVESHLPEVRRRRLAGESWNEIAAVVGLSRENVRALCMRHKLEPEVPCRGRIDRLLPRIMELRAEGRTAEEIAAQLGLRNKHAVNNALARAKRKSPAS